MSKSKGPQPKSTSHEGRDRTQVYIEATGPGLACEALLSKMERAILRASMTKTSFFDVVESVREARDTRLPESRVAKAVLKLEGEGFVTIYVA